jgi:hypothetical protein
VELAQRIDRLESREAIRNLVARYAILIDSRDLDALTELFVDDVRVTREERGHKALRALLEHLCRQFTTSVHFVGAQTLEFMDDDHAEGVVYCKAEHEYGAEWIVMAIQYYATDLNDPPTGPNKTRWTVSGPEELPGAYASWNRYWAPGAD